MRDMHQDELNRVAGGYPSDSSFPDSGETEYWQRELLAFQTGRPSVFGPNPQLTGDFDRL